MSSAKGRSRRYDIEFGVVGEPSNNKSNVLSASSNPHWKVLTQLRDILNEKRDLIYFVQVRFDLKKNLVYVLLYNIDVIKKILFHTLPELLEFVC